MSDISNVVNVAVLPEGSQAARDNMNAVCLITTEGPLNANERTRTYRTAKAVGEDFGTSSDTYAHAATFFSQQPNPINAVGSLIIGYHASTNSTLVNSVSTIHSEVPFRGYTVISATTDTEARALAAWSQANGVLGYDVFSSVSNLETTVGNPAWDIKLAGQTYYRMLYSAANNRHFATAYMSRMHTVNFNAENSAITANLKELKGIVAEPHKQTVIDKAKLIGLDIYTTVKTAPVVLSSGANDYQDNVYNKLGFIDAVQTDMFNLLKSTALKIPQTAAGVAQLIDQAIQTSNNFVRAGIFAPGEWSSPDMFGDVETFKRGIRENGFYWLAGPLGEQTQADRQARKSPVLQGAVKFAGGIHSVEIIINLNK